MWGGDLAGCSDSKRRHLPFLERGRGQIINLTKGSICAKHAGGKKVINKKKRSGGTKKKTKEPDFNRTKKRWGESGLVARRGPHILETSMSPKRKE